MRSQWSVRLACCVLGVLASGAWGQDPPADTSAAAGTVAARARGGFPDLVKGLRETPGCLGVETARTDSGKQVIFAWFENVKAARRWYHSATHRQAMDLMGMVGGPKPLRHIRDEAAPLLVIASLTMKANAARAHGELPISQISVEIYQPAPGGASMGGTFAPRALEIPHHQRSEAEDDADPDQKKESQPVKSQPPAAANDPNQR